ncbi:cytotoxic and regulatory T-cell molecule isoform X2 [Scyliorhinus canicula]|uniref:cytotoxic and regulatory T-cell molecule isoform X2 n=1 Tax=Scyliorhinus canicula TaxID=7830 RepID=UPI0018F2F803|nr:cytotoxic and regulatory T-cell molecule isoform X2 [Scyliorhinus canicula]
MATCSMLYLLAFLVLQANSATLPRENITVIEGQSVVLNCSMDGSEKAFIEWTNPRWQVTYFNNIRGLRDRRYKLVHYSSSKLIVTLLNTTVQDDGVYTCLYYDHQVLTKQVCLTVLAQPSPPVLTITTHFQKGREEKVIRCITTGSKPKAQITWLLNNRLELHGHTEYIPENNGAKFTTISTLKIKAHDQESRIDCLVRHESLNKVLTATHKFDNNYNSHGLTESYTQTANEMNTSSTSMPEPASASELFESVTQENRTEDVPTVNYIATTFISESAADGEQPEADTVENSTPGTNESQTESSLNSTSNTKIPPTETEQSTFQFTEDSSSFDKNHPHNLTEGTTESDVSETESSVNSTPSMVLPVTETPQNTSWNKADSFTSSYSNPHNSTENNTETNEKTINSTTAISLTNSSSFEQEDPIPTAKCENNQIMGKKEIPRKQQMKQSSALLLILVAFLICALLIVFQLFVLKIRKEHLKWRKQKDDSDLTVESNRSNRSSNEENVRPENNNRDPNFGTQYTIQIHSEEQMKQYTNNITEYTNNISEYTNTITEDEINTLDKESTV